MFILLGSFILIFSLFYFFLVDTTLRNEANRVFFENHQLNHMTLQNRIEVLKTSYADNELNWDTKDYTELNLIPDALQSFEIQALNRVFNDEVSDAIYLILKHPTLDQVAYMDFETVLSNIGISFFETGIIINQNGMIRYQSNHSLNHTNFFTSNLFSSSVYERLDVELYENASGFLNYDLAGRPHILAYTTLGSGYIYINSDLMYAYNEAFTPVTWGFMALGILVLIAFVIFSLLVLKRRFDDELVYEKLTQTVKSNVFVLEVGGLGQVRQANKLFISYTKDIEFTTLQDLSNDVIDMQQTLKNKEPFYLDLDKLEQKVRTRFIVNKYGRNYQLIGELIDSKSNVLDKYKDLALINQDTGLKNRLALEEFIDTLDRKEKYSFVVMGLRGFDEVSKNIGREKSKEMIQVFIKLIESKLYPNMLLFQLDKNEFIILQLKDFNYDVTAGWAKNMIDVIDKKILLEDLPIKLELDCGVMHNRGIVSNFESKEIINALEVTLERARTSSTTNLVVFSERYLDYRNKASQLEIDIRKGIEKDEFQMYMQPQYDLVEKRVVGFELLLRWNNPKYIKESPATYIRQAEKSNLIIDLGRVINEKVFQIAKKLEGMEIDVSFNISPRQLLQPGFINELIMLRDKYEVDTNRIAIELTETLLILQLDLIIEKFNALKELNFKIQLDDFGTGYSSLNYLKRLPIDNIKIDKLFVDEIETSSKARQILKTIIALGKNLKMGVIIEGVETEKQVEYIKKESSAIIQGFYVSRALPMQEALDFIKKQVKL